jgi:hypothetical protein
MMQKGPLVWIRTNCKRWQSFSWIIQRPQESQGRSATDVGGKGKQARFPVKPFVHGGVNDVKPGRPEKAEEGQYPHRPTALKPWPNGKPPGQGGHGPGDPQPKMTQPCKPFKHGVDNE